MTVRVAKGDRVKHASRTDWGLGEVLADPAGDRVQILFEDAGVKDFKLPVAQFVKVTGGESESAYLTGLVQHFVKVKAKPKAGGKTSHSLHAISSRREKLPALLPDWISGSGVRFWQNQRKGIQGCGS